MNILNWLIIPMPHLYYKPFFANFQKVKALPTHMNAPSWDLQRTAWWGTLGRLRIEFSPLVRSLWIVLTVFTVVSIWSAPGFSKNVSRPGWLLHPGLKCILELLIPHSLVQDGKWCITCTTHLFLSYKVRKYPQPENGPLNFTLSSFGLIKIVL